MVQQPSSVLTLHRDYLTWTPILEDDIHGHSTFFFLIPAQTFPSKAFHCSLFQCILHKVRNVDLTKCGQPNGDENENFYIESSEFYVLRPHNLVMV